MTLKERLIVTERSKHSFFKLTLTMHTRKRLAETVAKSFEAKKLLLSLLPELNKTSIWWTYLNSK